MLLPIAIPVGFREPQGGREKKKKRERGNVSDDEGQTILPCFINICICPPPIFFTFVLESSLTKTTTFSILTSPIWP